MRLHDIGPNAGARRASRRLGRGHGSGRGKTAGKGTKGQNARAGGGVHPRFEGGQIPMIKRLPFKRGVGQLVLDRTPTVAVNIGQLDQFEAGAVVNAEALARAGLIRSPRARYKILGVGELTRPLVVHAPSFSASAKEKIEAAGGTAVAEAAPVTEATQE